jgi:hypothetical protein
MKGPKSVHDAILGDKGVLSPGSLRKPHKQPHPTGVRRKLWKANRKVKRMVLGSDVGLEETCRMALCGLVDKISYNCLSKGPVSAWIEKNGFLYWVMFLKSFILLKDGWVLFVKPHRMRPCC